MQIAFAPVTNLQLFSPKRPLSRTKAPVSRTFEKLSFVASCTTSSRSALIYEADDATKPELSRTQAAGQTNGESQSRNFTKNSRVFTFFPLELGKYRGIMQIFFKQF